MKDIFLLLGQSNMAGRGDLNAVPAIDDSGIQMYRDNSWQKAVEPLHLDDPTAGVGLAMSFAQKLRQNQPNTEIGLIPCAKGSTPVLAWSSGDLYDNTIKTTKKALEQGHLKGILWQQGESDSTSLDNANNYAKNLKAFIAKIRKDLDNPSLPFIAGKLPNFSLHGEKCKYFHKVNEQFEKVQDEVSNFKLVDVEGLTLAEDNIHFDAKSLRTLGYSYYEAYSQLIG